MSVHCVECKTVREFQTPQNITMKSGWTAVTGTCAACKTKLFRIGG